MGGRGVQFVLVCVHKPTPQSWLGRCALVVHSQAVCSTPKCVELATEMYSLWSQMIIDKMCHEYNPGSCGEVMPMEEGKVYTDMYELSTSILFYQTLPNLCSDQCGASLLAWYSGWEPLIAESKCITTSAGSSSPFVLATTFMTISADCSQASVLKFFFFFWIISYVLFFFF